MGFDLDQPDFKTSLFGYNKEQVDSLHKKALVAFASLQQESDRLKEEMFVLKDELEMHRREKGFVHDALVSAQKTADELRTAAQKQAEEIVGEARQSAEAEKSVARQKLLEISEETERLRQDRRRFIEDFRLLLERYQRELHMVVHTEPTEVGTA